VKQVAHLTSVHQRSDIRIFLKQCRSLARSGYVVSLIVADGKGNGERDGVRILDTGASRGRLDRMLGATRRVLAKAVEVDADIYHIHDPELLFAGLTLKRRGKIVIFDAHEDLPQQILSKPYLYEWVRSPLSKVVTVVEAQICRRLDAVVGATPAITKNFVRTAKTPVNINNFPMIGELDNRLSWTEKKNEVCYVGGISAIRGIIPVVDSLAMCKSDARLNLAGEFAESATKTRAEHRDGWTKVDAHGFVTREGMRELLSRSVAGIVTFLPEPNHVEAQPNKMFEYMSAGLPVIASDFPLWREIIEGADCGLCVDPIDPAAIAGAIDRLVQDPALARRMGENGRHAVETKYNWGVEEQKLLDLYRKLLTRA